MHKLIGDFFLGCFAFLVIIAVYSWFNYLTPEDRESFWRGLMADNTKKEQVKDVQ